MGKYLRISSYIRKPFLIYDFAKNCSTLDFLVYEENLIFFFISVRLYNIYISTQTAYCPYKDAGCILHANELWMRTYILGQEKLVPKTHRFSSFYLPFLCYTVRVAPVTEKRLTPAGTWIRFDSALSDPALYTGFCPQSTELTRGPPESVGLSFMYRESSHRRKSAACPKLIWFGCIARLSQWGGGG